MDREYCVCIDRGAKRKRPNVAILCEDKFKRCGFEVSHHFINREQREIYLLPIEL